MEQGIWENCCRFINELRSNPEQQTLGIVDLFAAKDLSYDETILHDGTKVRLVHYLAEVGDELSIQKLAKLADATATTEGEFTPLHLAAAKGREKVVAELLLLDKWPNVKVDAASSDGITPLILAAYGGFSSVVKLLLKRYGTDTACDVNATDCVLGRTALHYAVGKGHKEVVKLLVSFPGIELCPKDSVRGLTPLLMELMKPKDACNLDLIKKLSKSKPHQMNVKVGPDGKSMVELEMNMRRRTWRTFCPIKLFKSDKVLLRDDKVLLRDETSPKLKVSMNLGTYQKEERKKERERIEKEMRNCDISSSRRAWKRAKPTQRTRSLKLSGDDLSSAYWKLERKPTDMTGESQQTDITGDRYLMYRVSMRGHTALHIAATQDNAEALSHLLKCSRIDVNIRAADDGFEMTPLHCAVRTEAIGAFTRLIAHEKVDVNAGLRATEGARAFKRPPWTGLALQSWWKSEDAEPYRIWKTPSELDTPLHLAIRYCNSATLRKMVLQLCNDERFKPCLYNEDGVFPLDLAWLRSSCSLPFGVSSIHLQSAVCMLEQQPGNEQVMNDVNSMKAGTQYFVNTILVTATLLGAVTFSALLQPAESPLYFKAVRLFWLFNYMSFFFAMYTILCCLGITMVTDMHTVHTTGVTTKYKETSLRLFYAHKRAELVVPLIFCVISGVGAFGGAGYIKMPHDARNLLLVCTVLGLVLVLSQAAVRVLFTFRLYLDSKEGHNSSLDGVRYLLYGLLVECPWELVRLPYILIAANHNIPVYRTIHSGKARLAILALHVYGILAIMVYELIVFIRK